MKKFTYPEITISTFEIENIVTASGGGTVGKTASENAWEKSPTLAGLQNSEERVITIVF